VSHLETGRVDCALILILILINLKLRYRGFLVLFLSTRQTKKYKRFHWPPLSSLYGFHHIKETGNLRRQQCIFQCVQKPPHPINVWAKRKRIEAGKGVRRRIPIPFILFAGRGYLRTKHEVNVINVGVWR